LNGDNSIAIVNVIRTSGTHISDTGTGNTTTPNITTT